MSDRRNLYHIEQANKRHTQFKRIRLVTKSDPTETGPFTIWLLQRGLRCVSSSHCSTRRTSHTINIVKWTIGGLYYRAISSLITELAETRSTSVPTIHSLALRSCDRRNNEELEILNRQFQPDTCDCMCLLIIIKIYQVPLGRDSGESV
jgi:hypothetical protein